MFSDLRCVIGTDEAAELRRRLADGTLTAEEEAAMRARLAQLEGLENSLLEQQEAVLSHIDQQLQALADEESDLRRRIAAGDLTAEEEAALRARLMEIDRLKHNTLEQRRALMNSSVGDAVSALDDAEAWITNTKRSGADDSSDEIGGAGGGGGGSSSSSGGGFEDKYASNSRNHNGITDRARHDGTGAFPYNP